MLRPQTDQHRVVTLEVKCLDRLYLNGYIGPLATSGGLVNFIHARQLGKPIARLSPLNRRMPSPLPFSHSRSRPVRFLHPRQIGERSQSQHVLNFTLVTGDNNTSHSPHNLPAPPPGGFSLDNPFHLLYPEGGGPLSMFANSRGSFTLADAAHFGYRVPACMGSLRLTYCKG